MKRPNTHIKWLLVGFILIILILNILTIYNSVLFYEFGIGRGIFSFLLSSDINIYIFSILSIIFVLIVSISKLADEYDDIGLYLIGLGLTIGVLSSSKCIYTIIFLSLLQVVIYHLAYKGRRYRELANLDRAFIWNCLSVLLIIIGLSYSKIGFSGWAFYPLGFPPSTIGSILMIVGLVGLASQPPFHLWLSETTSGRPTNSALIASTFAVIPPFYLIMKTGAFLNPTDPAIIVGSIIGILGFLGLSAKSLIENRIDRQSGILTSALMGLSIFTVLRIGVQTHFATIIIILLSSSRLISFMTTTAMEDIGYDRDMRKFTSLLGKGRLLPTSIIIQILLIFPVFAPAFYPSILMSIALGIKVHVVIFIIIIVGLILFTVNSVKLIESTIGGKKTPKTNKVVIRNEIFIALTMANCLGIIIALWVLFHPLLRIIMRV
ncbi:MAG: proton-conducting transporter transmembrane domain-containing protein [bacterium]